MFDESDLGVGESIVLALRPHWWYFFTRAMPKVGLFVLGMFFVLVGLNTGSGSLMSIALLIFTAAFSMFVWDVLSWQNTTFTITSDRVVSRHGVFNKSGVEIPLDSINNVKYSANLLERLVGAGDIDVDSANTKGRTKFDDIKGPKNVQRVIHDAKKTKDMDLPNEIPTAPPARKGKRLAVVKPEAEKGGDHLVKDGEEIEILEDLTEEMPDVMPSGQPARSVGVPAPGIAQQIAELAEMRDAGTITSEEFFEFALRVAGSATAGQS